MRSVPPCGSGWVSIIKVRQVISLSVQYIVDCSFNASFVPQPPLATFVCPRTESMRPKTILSQLPGRVRLKGIEYKSGSLVTCRHNSMDVICAHVDCS